jgi:hypothetical protein
MRKRSSVCLNESNEIEIPKSVGEKMTISNIWGHDIAVVAESHLWKEKKK